MVYKKPQTTTPWRFYVLYQSQPRGWSPLEPFQVQGPNWQANFRDSSSEVPYARMLGDETIEIRKDRYAGPCVEIIADTSEKDFDRAVDIGRPAADIIAGILIHRLSSQIINRKLWLGLMGTRDDGSTFLAMGEKFWSWRGAPIDKLKERAAEVSIFDPSKLSSIRSIIPVAYRWFLKGLLETDRNDQFISIWLSALALYTSWCNSRKKSYSNWCKKQRDARNVERNRMRYYVQDKLKLSGDEQDAFFAVLNDSYSLRHELIHESKIDVIKDDHIRQLARVTGSMLWVEMGFPLGGSPAVLVKP